jgi:hypothetical protein
MEPKFYVDALLCILLLTVVVIKGFFNYRLKDKVHRLMGSTSVDASYYMTLALRSEWLPILVEMVFFGLIMWRFITLIGQFDMSGAGSTVLCIGLVYFGGHILFWHRMFNGVIKVSAKKGVRVD